MYQPGRSSASLGRIAILLAAFSLSMRAASTAVGQETGAAEPRRLEPNQQGAVSGHIPQRTSPFDAAPFTPANFQPPADDRTKKSAAQAADRPAPRSPVTLAGFDAPANQEQPTARTQDPSSALPRSAIQNPAPAAPPPLPLSRSNLATPISPAAESGEAEATTGGMPGMESLLTVAGSLGIVMGLFMVTMWCLRRGMPKSARALPPEVVEVLGRAPLAGKQQMHLIRFGSKLVLATVSPSGIDAVSEITDPVEADRLLGYCEQTRSSSATSSFRGILDRLDERSVRNAEEHARRPHREYSALVGHKHARTEDEYA
jgi:flagellar biogenesis protein FliO